MPKPSSRRPRPPSDLTERRTACGGSAGGGSKQERDARRASRARAPELAPPRDRVKGISVVFSRGGELADSVITRMARQERRSAAAL